LGPLQPVVAARIIRQACVALQTAHVAGVIHRDIKPANIYLDQDASGTVTVRVLDFGIAKWRGENASLTRTGTLLGTPHYMSPEAAQDSKHVQPLTDVWSLAISLYEALCGRTPFEDAETIGKLYVAIMTSEVPALQDLAPWVAPGLAAVVHGALLRDPVVRCPTAPDLAQALLPFTAGSDELTAGMFESLAADQLDYRAPRADLPTQWRVTHIAPPASSATLLTEIDDPLLGTTLEGRYTLLRRLGKGGMGAVYEAQAPDGNRYAVKVIDPAAASKGDNVRRFVREARAVMTIDSPYVVQVLEADAVSQEQLPYIVMELLQGWDLGAMIERRGPLQPRTVARLFIQACRGLTAAHEAGFVHRDIKPANLFLNELPSGEVTVKICDFGIVKRVLTDDEHSTVALTQVGGVVGSPLYMSPEQAKNSPDIDLRTDVWSLGVAMFEALSGTHPWEGRGSVGELIVAICTEALPHVQDSAPWVPADLATIVHRAMSRQPTERFQSMAALEKALEPFAEGTPNIQYDGLQPVPQRLRGQVATRVEDRGGSTSAALSLAQTVTVIPKQSNRPLLAVGAAVLVLGLGAGLYVAFGRSPQPSDAPHGDGPALTQPTDPGSAAPAPFQVFVTIEPAAAKVSVDGEHQQLQAGRLVLRGGPGQSFEVTVTDGDQKLERTVVITDGGQAAPSRLELAQAAGSASATGAQPVPVAGKPPPSTSGAGPASSTPVKPRPPDKPRDLTTDTWP
ncbi:MAG: serine/threonine protein kinase, partial [Deltaproteobacteria bacterium]|nr:serine/threonine protein kinase [Deltaproteobacteria bacterium]